MPTAEAVARYFLHLAANAPEPSPLTHMQLHKLLYYAQGWTLACSGRQLFDGELQAWVHGPVVPDFYQRFERFGGHEIPEEEARVAPELTAAERGTVESIWQEYGRYSASGLRQMTHAERPWREARGMLQEGQPGRTPISLESLRSFFTELRRRRLAAQGIDADEFDASLRDAREGRTIPWEQVVAEHRANQAAARLPSASAPIGDPRRARG